MYAQLFCAHFPQVIERERETERNCEYYFENLFIRLFGLSVQCLATGIHWKVENKKKNLEKSHQIPSVINFNIIKQITLAKSNTKLF